MNALAKKKVHDSKVVTFNSGENSNMNVFNAPLLSGSLLLVSLSEKVFLPTPDGNTSSASH